MTPEILTMIAQRNRALETLNTAILEPDPAKVKTLIVEAIETLRSVTSPAPRLVG